MDKPISIAREDFLKGLIRLVNGCGLPPCVAAEVLHGVTAEVDRIASEQLARDREAWEKAKKEEEKDG